jgi:hypothetical protein
MTMSNQVLDKGSFALGKGKKIWLELALQIRGTG